MLVEMRLLGGEHRDLWFHEELMLVEMRLLGGEHRDLRLREELMLLEVNPQGEKSSGNFSR